LALCPFSTRYSTGMCSRLRPTPSLWCLQLQSKFQLEQLRHRTTGFEHLFRAKLGLCLLCAIWWWGGLYNFCSYCNIVREYTEYCNTTVCSFLLWIPFIPLQFFSLGFSLQDLHKRSFCLLAEYSLLTQLCTSAAIPLRNEQHGLWGQWSVFKYCDEGSFVYGVRAWVSDSAVSWERGANGKGVAWHKRD